MPLKHGSGIPSPAFAATKVGVMMVAVGDTMPWLLQ